MDSSEFYGIGNNKRRFCVDLFRGLASFFKLTKNCLVSKLILKNKLFFLLSGMFVYILTSTFCTVLFKSNSVAMWTFF
eukprot:UN05087